MLILYYCISNNVIKSDSIANQLMYKKLKYLSNFLLFNSISRLTENQLNGNIDADI